jgi:TorA maturation chaperone TorD
MQENSYTVCRANAYHLLALALERPDDWQPDLSDRFSQNFAAFGTEMERLALQVADRMKAVQQAPEAASVAHAKLCVGPYETLASPYACAYLDPEQRLMGPVSQEAARAYADAGLGPGSLPLDAPDHITHELEFMYCLAFKEATTLDPEWTARQQSFWNSHLGLWLPRFAAAVADAGVHPFYQALAALVKEFCRTEAALWSTDQSVSAE